MQTTVLDAALEYCKRGWSVFPLKDKRRPYIDWGPYKDRRPTEEEVVSWWTLYPDAWIAVALGRVSNLLRLDADGEQALAELERLGGTYQTLQFTTPSGGTGYLLKYADGIITEVLWRGDGDHQELRIQSDGAYTVVPPSPDYAWTDSSVPIAPIPRWLRDRNVERVLRDLERELRPTLRQPDKSEVLECLEHISPEDYDTWVQVGMALRSIGDEYLRHWTDWSRQSPKFKDGECEKKWATFRTDGCGLTARSLFHWAEQYDGWRPPNRHEPLTDLGNARVLARIGEGKVLHSDRWGWLAWDGRRWALHAEKQVVEMQKAALEYRLNRAVDSLAKHMKSDRDAQDFVSKQKQKVRTMITIRKHEDETRIRGARTLAESEPQLCVDYRKFDRHPYLFNCLNCTVDIRTLDTYAHVSSNYITQLCEVPYETDAACPRWLQFLEETIPDKDVRDFLWMFLGCCLTGDVSPQIMPVFWGSGANGKSTLVNTVMYVLGEDYSMKAKRDLLMLKRSSEHPTSIARLYGKRFVACVETAEDGRLDETLVKELTGGDPLAARRMREDEWQFMPTHKPVLVTNHRPEVRGTDDGIWRRLPLVPFTVQFLDAKRDPELSETLKKEAPGILRWMVEGGHRWIQGGRKFFEPAVVREATSAYREEQDRIGAFIADRCIADKERRVRVEKLMEAYASWCIANKHVQLNGSAFGRAMTERGFPLNEKRGKYRLGLDLQEKQ